MGSPTLSYFLLSTFYSLFSTRHSSGTAYRSAVFNFLGIFMSTSCDLPALFNLTLKVDFVLAPLAASARSFALVMFFPSNWVMISPSLIPAFSAGESETGIVQMDPLGRKVSRLGPGETSSSRGGPGQSVEPLPAM